MRTLGNLVAGTIGAVIIFIALIVIVSSFGGSSDNQVPESSCHSPGAIALYGSYEKCADFARSIGSDPETGLPK